MPKNYKTISQLLFPENATAEKTSSQKFDDLLRTQLKSVRAQRMKILNPDNEENLVDENYVEIANFIKSHVLEVGKEQAVKDFQCGLNFLHKDFITPLREDGDFGEKTFKAFYDIFKYYEIDVIKNAIRKGALSNAVIGTTSNKDINTDALVKNVQKNLEIGNEG